MPQVQAVEVKRAFSSRSLWIALAVGAIVVAVHALSHVIPDSRAYIAGWGGRTHTLEYPLSLYEVWLGARPGRPEGQVFFLLLPLLAALPYGTSFLEDRSSGYVAGIVTRAARGRYYAAKSVAVFLAGGVAVTLPLLLDFAVTALFFPALAPEPVTGTFPLRGDSLGGDLFYSQPLAYVLLSLVVLFLWSGLIGCLTVPLAYLVSNRIVVVLIPFALYLFLEFGADALSVLQYSPMTFLRPDQAVSANLPVLTVGWLALAVVVAAFLAWRARVDETL
ncbi:MAG: hypothetical protein LBS56_00145 [Propionibacteriaceae bacterium]|jgi:hypothetical protein|nr:hypothetical protein [Propionibacteriaceae bacterium]